MRWWGNQGGQKPKGGRRERAGKASPDTDALEDGPEQVDASMDVRSRARGKSFSPFSLLLLFDVGGGRREGKISLQKSCLMGGKEKANRRVGKVIC